MTKTNKPLEHVVLQLHPTIYISSHQRWLMDVRVAERFGMSVKLKDDERGDNDNRVWEKKKSQKAKDFE